ncbi:hypothetical protein DPMN_010118 [Dreissena polymorpha]|uniref:Uncharacterized protein n=1 Tax=Dreissena polymorpha TaxID=45954 RepID=A0A9D4MY77_DREPO|nr:hypothetical protein DPMN_010118 [Dreissena polymorpha]
MLFTSTKLKPRNRNRSENYPWTQESAHEQSGICKVPCHKHFLNVSKSAYYKIVHFERCIHMSLRK